MKDMSDNMEMKAHLAQLARASQTRAAEPVATPDDADPTFRYRRNLANISEAVMMRVVEMEAAGNAMLEAAKKLRAAVVANT